MQKVIIMLTLAFAATLGTILVFDQISYAQQNITETASNTPTNFTKLFSENKEYQQCFSLIGPEQCFPAIEVLHQSPTTIVLKSDVIDVIWKAVDAVKKEGYKVDDVTSFFLSGIGSDSDQTINILVVMSK
ncbi:MAG: hypothetical protein AB7F29_14000 [Candidatus Nitrosocosmicus sp.]